VSASGFNSGLGMAQSYYAATANPFAPAPVLQGSQSADVVVIGGGVTGLSAALFAREKGYSVILLEAGRIGWGASGRNGGQTIPGLRKGAAELIKMFGKARARALFDLSLEAREATLGLIEKYKIDCDVRANGHLAAAAKPRDMHDLEEEAHALAVEMDYPHVALLSADAVHEKLASPLYHGGLIDKLGGHLHPLNYTLGLAEAARREGVALYENSEALQIDRSAGVYVKTMQGDVRARFGVIACDALLGKLEPKIAGRIMPVANYIAATEKLDEPVIADDLAVSDTKFVVNYFRMSADGRLIFGGGERYTPEPPTNIAGFVRPFMARVFPQLRYAKIEYAWGGLVSITLSRFPHIGRIGETFYAHGYSGQGVLLSALAGKVLAEAMSGTAERFDLLGSLAPPEFPGGAALRAPLHVLGMLYYAMQDRL
jgi:gamma-glutamylputrescine oxidase